jgi:hypothetical protein
MLDLSGSAAYELGVNTGASRAHVHTTECRRPRSGRRHSVGANQNFAVSNLAYTESNLAPKKPPTSILLARPTPNDWRDPIGKFRHQIETPGAITSGST